MDYKGLIDEIIAPYKDHPIDILGIGAANEEYQYLRSLRYAYTRTIKDLAPLLPKDSRVLEIGSLLGVVSIALTGLGFKVSGTDIPEFFASEKLQALYKRNSISFDKLNLREYNLPYPDSYFNAVILCEVLEHLNFNPLPVFKEINRILKPQGYIYVAMPNQACIDNRLKLLFGLSIHDPIQYFFDQLDSEKNIIVSRHWKEYTMKEAVEMIDRMGFEVVRNYYFSENGPRNEVQIQTLVRKIFHAVPSFRSSLVIIGRKKEKVPDYNFRFTESVL